MKDDFKDIQQLSAYLDNELTSTERQDIQKRLRDESAFSQLHLQLKQNDLAYQDAVSSIDQRPIPDAISRALETTSDTGPRARLINRYFGGKILSRLAAVAPTTRAIAASLFVIIGAALFFLIPQEEGIEPTMALESKTVRDVLSELVAGQSTRVGEAELTEVFAFMRDDGALCKHFTLTSQRSAVSAISCYQQGQWSPVVAEETRPPALATDEYQPAGAQHTLSVDQYIDNRIQGTSLSVEQERQIMQSKRR